MNRVMTILLLIINCGVLYAQNAEARKANKLYKQGKYDDAIKGYQQSLKKQNTQISSYNLGNAYFRKQQFAEAAGVYEGLANGNAENTLRQRTLYNEGVSLSKQKKLEESIEAYKKAVKLDPKDDDARINLQKALLELRKKQPPKKEEEPKNNKKQKKDQKKQPPASNLSKKEVERLLKALQQKEQQVQQKMQQNRSRSAGQQEKDW